MNLMNPILAIRLTNYSLTLMKRIKNHKMHDIFIDYSLHYLLYKFKVILIIVSNGKYLLNIMIMKLL